MKTIKVKPVEIVGHCRARLTPEDEFVIEDTRLENFQHSRLCLLALGHLPPIVKLLQSENRFYARVTCPECVSRPGCENRVVFLLGHADKWELCQTISEYRYLLKQSGEESERARQLETEATQYQNQGDYLAATQKMAAAVAELKRALAL
jgi:uncharacterized repeat protein (TIGR04076 family)